MIHKRAVSLTAKLLLCLLVACPYTESVPDHFDPLFEHLSLYSAFDGEQAYAITPSIPGIEGSLASDPIIVSTLRWEEDKSFLRRDEFPELPGSIKLTTKKAGTTTIFVVGKTVSGAHLHGKLDLKISYSRSDSREWDAADARYNSGEDVASTWPNFPPAEPGEGTCGLPYIIDLPRTAACVGCHDNRDAASVEITPTQIAHYTDEELVAIVVRGAKPPLETFKDPQLLATPMPDCTFAAFHAWDLTPVETRGIVWKLRSLEPRVIDTPR